MGEHNDHLFPPDWRRPNRSESEWPPRSARAAAVLIAVAAVVIALVIATAVVAVAWVLISSAWAGGLS